MTAAAPGTRFRTQGGHMTAYFGLAQLHLPLTPVVLHTQRTRSANGANASSCGGAAPRSRSSASRL